MISTPFLEGQTFSRIVIFPNKTFSNNTERQGKIVRLSFQLRNKFSVDASLNRTNPRSNLNTFPGRLPMDPLVNSSSETGADGPIDIEAWTIHMAFTEYAGISPKAAPKLPNQSLLRKPTT